MIDSSAMSTITPILYWQVMMKPFKIGVYKIPHCDLFRFATDLEREGILGEQM